MLVIKILSFFRDYTRKKVPLRGSNGEEFRFRVFRRRRIRCQELAPRFPDTRHPLPETFSNWQHVVRKKRSKGL